MNFLRTIVIDFRIAKNTFYRFSVITTIITFLLIRNIHAATLDCEFKSQMSHWGSDYTCVAKNFRTTLKDRQITSLTGLHDFKKTNDDVKTLFVKKQSVLYLPMGLANFFKNLETLYVMNSNLQHLMNGDLDGLTKLKIFDVSHNPIEQLGRDFFKGHPTIEKVSFFECHLKIIDPQALDPLVNLQEAHFQYNVCLDVRGDDVTKLSDLKAEIRDKCLTKYYDAEIFRRINETTSCNNAIAQKPQSLSFTRKNANVIIFFLAIMLIVVSLVLVQIFRNTFRNNWSELRNNFF